MAFKRRRCTCGDPIWSSGYFGLNLATCAACRGALPQARWHRFRAWVIRLIRRHRLRNRGIGEV
jgi:hypothetical protein